MKHLLVVVTFLLLVVSSISAQSNTSPIECEFYITENWAVPIDDTSQNERCMEPIVQLFAISAGSYTHEETLHLELTSLQVDNYLGLARSLESLDEISITRYMSQSDGVFEESIQILDEQQSVPLCMQPHSDYCFYGQVFAGKHVSIWGRLLDVNGDDTNWLVLYRDKFPYIAYAYVGDLEIRSQLGNYPYVAQLIRSSNLPFTPAAAVEPFELQRVLDFESNSFAVVLGLKVNDVGSVAGLVMYNWMYGYIPLDEPTVDALDDFLSTLTWDNALNIMPLIFPANSPRA